MIDTVGLHVLLNNPGFRLGGISDVQEIVKTKTGEVFHTGYIKNLRVKQIREHLFIKGSFPKFLNNSNCSLLNAGDVNEILLRLSSMFNADIRKASVFRLDIGATLDLERLPIDYFSGLGELNYFTRAEIGNGKTLQYTNKSRAVIFYDKLFEMRKKGCDIPVVPFCGTLLRYEVQLKKRPAKYIAEESIIADKLADESFILQLANYWVDMYSSINRVNKLNLPGYRLPALNCKTLSDQLAAIGLHSIGVTELNRHIKSIPSDNFHNKNQKSRMHKRVMDLSNNKQITETNEAIIELDKKIINTYQKIKGEMEYERF